MTLPLVVLSVFAVAIGWIGIEPGFPVLGGLVPDWLGEFLGSMLGEHGGHAAGHNILPILTSIVLATGGLLLGWLVYRNFSNRESKDPLERLTGAFYKVMQNKYYFDELYALIFIRPSQWISETFTYKWLDLKIIDGILHGIARIGMWLGRVFRNVFDLPVINGAGDAVGEGTRGFGSVLRRIQTGRVQQYMVIALVAVFVAGILIFTLIW
jgi:NADH-quinone oxidoreductase subunit L